MRAFNVAAAAGTLLAATLASASKQPNFLFLITDDQDRGGLGSFSVMPNTQRLIFNAGLNFSSAFVSSPVCCPSRTSLFSGRQPHNIGDVTLGWCGNFSQDRENTFTTSLGNAGYRIGQFGKWYNQEPSFCKPGYAPQWKQGTSPRAQQSDFFVQCQEVTYYNLSYNANGEIIKTGDAPTDYLTAVVGNRSLSWLNNVTSGPDADQPWMAYVALHAPHLPAEPAPWYTNAPVPGVGAPRTPNFNAGWEDKHFQVDNGVSVPMSTDLINGSDVLWAHRLRALMSVDDVVGDIMSLLQSRGALDNTYIIYTSDHGYHLGQHGVWSEKAGPYQYDSNVPLAIAGPGITPGTVTEALVTNIDLPPTLLELAGIPDQWPDGSGRRDGTSLVPLITATSAVAAPSASTSGPSEVAASGKRSADVDHGEQTVIPIPLGWRDRLLIQWIGWETLFQWLSPCTFGLTAQSCDALGPNPPAGMTNAASNCWTAIRVVNETTNFLYAEYRGPLAPLQPSSTNWTEVYNLTADPWQMTNLAVKNRLPPGQLAAMSAELWSVATCVGASCP